MIAVDVFYKAHSPLQCYVHKWPRREHADPTVNSRMLLCVAVCAFRELRIPPTQRKITEKKLRTR